MFQIDLQSRVPIYDQIVDSVMRLKSAGVLRAGDQLPSVRSTALRLGVNPNTVQKAYAILEQKGITVSAAGRGSFLADSKEAENELKRASLQNLQTALTKAQSAGVSKAEAAEILDNIFGGGKE